MSASDEHSPRYWTAPGVWPECSCGFAPRDNALLYQHWASHGLEWYSDGGQLHSRAVARPTRVHTTTPDVCWAYQQGADPIVDDHYQTQEMLADTFYDWLRGIKEEVWNDCLSAHMRAEINAWHNGGEPVVQPNPYKRTEQS